MLKIEKIKEEILNFNHENDVLRCYLAQIATNQNYSVNCYRGGNVNCSKCLRLSLLELLEEYKEPIKLTRFEYEYLKVAKENEYNFIARDKNGTLVIYNIAPHKTDTLWCTASAKWDKEEVFYNYPNCGVPLPYNFDYDYQIKNKCCLECRQVLDWSDENDR